MSQPPIPRNSARRQADWLVMPIDNDAQAENDNDIPETLPMIPIAERNPQTTAFDYHD